MRTPAWTQAVDNAGAHCPAQRAYVLIYKPRASRSRNIYEIFGLVGRAESSVKIHAALFSQLVLEWLEIV